MNLNERAIYKLNEKGLLKELAVFIKFKSVHINSCIFNYNLKYLASETGLSLSTVRKHVKFFLKNGWARMDGNNLILEKIKKISYYKRKDCKITGNTIKEILYDLSSSKGNACGFGGVFSLVLFSLLSSIRHLILLVIISSYTVNINKSFKIMKLFILKK